MILDEIRLRFALIKDDSSQKLCAPLADAVFSLAAQVEHLTSSRSLRLSDHDSIDALQRAAVLCREHGQQLLKAHPNSNPLRIRLTLLNELVSQMRTDELEGEYENVPQAAEPNHPPGGALEEPLFRVR
ncbi:hypothetical protein, partial [Acetobacter oeni]